MFGLHEKDQTADRPEPVRTRSRLGSRILAVAAAALVLLLGTQAVRHWTADQNGARERISMVDDVSGYTVPDAMVEGASAPRSAQLKNTGSARDIKTAKIIRTFAFTLSTRNFDEDLAAIREALSTHQGYVEESSLSSDYGERRTAYLRVRVPRETVDQFTASLKGIGRALDVRETAEDVSEQYADIQMRLNTQEAKLKRLQEMLKQAVSVEELLEIESAIADTQYQVDSLTGSLKGMDSKVDYATVTISLKEEKQQDTAQIKEETLGERMKSALGAMLGGIKAWMEDMLVFLVAALPVILIVLALIVVIKVIYKRRKKS